MHDPNVNIVDLIQKDARRSFNALAREVGLSTPAVADRIRRMQAGGFIQGFRTLLSRVGLGWQLSAFAAIRPSPGQTVALIKFLQTHPQIIDAYRVSGPDGYRARLIARDTVDLAKLTDRLDDFGTVEITVILDTVAENKPYPVTGPVSIDRKTS